MIGLIVVLIHSGQTADHLISLKLGGAGGFMTGI